VEKQDKYQPLTPKEDAYVALLSKSLFNGVTLLLCVVLMIGIVQYWPEPLPENETITESVPQLIDPADIVDSIHVPTGLAYDNNFLLVKNSCTRCHSAKIITQNRMTRDQWKATIVWMQATQELGDLGEAEVLILDYLEQHYAPTASGRRKPLTIEEWYVLDSEPNATHP